MKQRAFQIGGGIVAIAVLVAAMGLVISQFQDGDAVAQEQPESFPRTISVNGSGQVSVVPDIAVVSVGVDVLNEDLNAAQTEATEKANAIIAAVQAAGVAENDIQTANYSIWPEYKYNNDGTTGELVGYRVNHLVNIKVRAMETTGDVIAAAVDAGANAVHGISFTVSDPNVVTGEAREAAMANAREKAEDLAGLSGGSLGVVVSVSESSWAPYPVDGRSVAEDAANAPPINPGETMVTVELTVVWELN